MLARQYCTVKASLPVKCAFGATERKAPPSSSEGKKTMRLPYLSGGEPQPELHKCKSPCVASPKSHQRLSGVLRDMAGKQHKVVNNFTKPAALNLPLSVWLVL